MVRPVKKGSVRYLRSVVRSLINILRLYREVVGIRLELRANKLKDLEDAIKLFNDLSKGWLIGKIKKPLMSIVADPTLILDYT